MSKAIEEMINRTCEERTAFIASNLLQMDTLTYEQIAKATELPIAKVQK